MDIRFVNEKTFNRNIKKHVRNFNDNELVKFIQGLALYLLDGFARRTPVDTGLARNNWQLSRGSMNSDELPAEPGGEEVVARAVETIKQITDMEKLGQIIWIYNNIEYTIYLENGTANHYGFSPKAPEGMVKVTFAEILSLLSSKFNFVGYYEAKT